MPGISRRQNLSSLQRARGEMPSISRRQHLSDRRSARDEAGFALVEVMVSAVLLIALALSTLAVLDRSQSTSSNNRSRAVASQLAQNEQDAIRQMPMSALAGGFHPGTVPKKVGEITYDVTSSAEWVQDSGGAVTCSTNTGRVEYLATSTTVTWPGMGSIKPVVADGVVSPGVAALGANKGALTVLLSRADGTGTAGITVTVQGQSGVTDENGCAVIGNLDAGVQTLTYNTGGYVDENSKQSVSKPVTIGAGTIAQATGYYDNPGTLAVSLVSDGQGGDGTWPKVTIDHANRAKPSAFTLDTDTATKHNASVGLFPFDAPYKAYPGECSGNDPSNKLYVGNPGAGGGLVTSGSTTTAILPMRTAVVKINDAATSAPYTGGEPYTVYVIAEKADGKGKVMDVAGCQTTYGPWSGSASELKLSLPTGVWRVCANFKRTSSGKWSPTKPTIVGGSLTTDEPLIVTPASVTGDYLARLQTTLVRSSNSSGNYPNSGDQGCS
jgi:Tfp pilus assembly protein PilV